MGKYDSFHSLISKIIISLKEKHKLQVHEDAVSIVIEWNQSRKKTDCSDSESEEEESKNTVNVDP